MEIDVETLCQAAYGQLSDERINSATATATVLTKPGPAKSI